MVDRGEACAQGHSASSPYSQLRDTGPECAWGPEGRSPRSPSRLPGPRPNPAAHPLRAAQLGLARPGWGREVGARTSKRPARPAELQASGGEQHEAADPGPPHPAAPSRGRAELYLRRPLPAARPEPGEGRCPQPRSPTGRGTSATCSCCPGSARVGGPGEIRGG